jgi:AmmeMemoRadiSam system protein A
MVRMPSIDGQLSDAERRQLVAVAWQSIESGITYGKPCGVEHGQYSEKLWQIGASFVTLKINTNLRGCIGTLDAYRPLIEDVAANAFAAGFLDPRFEPLSRTEVTRVNLSIAVLSRSTPIAFTTEQELIDQLRPGVDGIVIAQGDKRATFLPAVWEMLPNPTDFIAQLKRKAGIVGSLGLSADRYTVEEIPA